MLPLDQILIVQNEVRKLSTGYLDTAFAKMHSIIVSDPSNPHLLLVVIDAAALSENSVELVRLIPVPFYKENELIAYTTMLDYEFTRPSKL